MYKLEPTAEIINVETHPSVLVENLIKVPIEPKPLSHTLMHGLCTNPLGHAVITLCFTCPICGMCDRTLTSFW